jgi:hypothetical protein
MIISNYHPQCTLPHHNYKAGLPFLKSGRGLLHIGGKGCKISCEILTKWMAL